MAAHTFRSAAKAGVLLFDEDFDRPAREPEPEVIEPVFSAAELMAARDEAAQEARDRAFAEAEASSREVAARALTAIATQLAAARDEAAAVAEQSAEAIARLLLGCFATVFPALSARHGAGEVASLLRQILPALHREPKIVVRLNPHLVPQITEALHTLDADLTSCVRLTPTEAVAIGDVRIAWDHGAAERDAAALWLQIEAVLAPAGLLSASPPNPLQTAKEPELVE